MKHRRLGATMIRNPKEGIQSKSQEIIRNMNMMITVGELWKGLFLILSGTPKLVIATTNLLQVSVNNYLIRQVYL